MADYWKSNPRKYCEVCKCWFSDNKISIDFHESGRRHQENVKKQLTQARLKHVENEKEQEKMAKQLAAIEQAAIQAYQKDLAVEYCGGTVQEASQAKIAQQWDNPEYQQLTVSQRHYQQQQQDQGEVKQKIQENIEKKLKELKNQQEAKQTMEQSNSQAWQQYTSPEGYPYYYNTVTGVSQWEVPAELQNQQQSSNTQQEQPPSQSTSDTKKEKSSTNKSMQVSAGQKRGAEQASVESSEKYQAPKRSTAGPYGAWTTVRVVENDEEENDAKTEQQQNKEEEKYESSDEEEGQDDVMQIREKTLSGLDRPSEGEQAGEGGGRVSFKAFGFKKRTGNRPQIRQRTGEI